MAWIRAFAAGLIIGVAALGAWIYATRVGDAVLRDFTAELHLASLRRPTPDVFTVGDVTIAGETHPSISASGPSRVAWDFQAAAPSRLEVQAGIPEAVRAAHPQGLLFRVGISADGRYEELFTQMLTPATTAAHAGWVPVSIDLTPYDGRQISLIFNTGGPGAWGSPRLIGR